MKQRNNGLDLLKCLCAFLVVCIHTDHAYKVWLSPWARMAVPTFFLISGYFYTHRTDRRRQLARVTLLAVGSNLLYAAYSLARELVRGGTATALLLRWTDPQTWTDLLLYNASVTRGHLWYLNALGYVLVIVWAADAMGHRRKLYPLIPVLLIGNLVLGNYALAVLGQEVELIVSRNYLFMGLPCFLLGNYLREHPIRCHKNTLWMTLIGSLIGVQAERLLLCHFGLYQNQEFFACTVFSAVSAFELARRWDGANCAVLARLGRDLALGIYLLHPMLVTELSELSHAISQRLPLWEKLYSHTAPAIVFAATALVAWLLNRCRTALSKTA